MPSKPSTPRAKRTRVAKEAPLPAKPKEHARVAKEAPLPARPKERARTTGRVPPAETQKIYGLAAVLAVMAKRPEQVLSIAHTRALRFPLADVLREAAKRRVAYREVDEEELSRLAESLHHEGVCLLARKPAALDLETLARRTQPRGLIVALDGVQNPHNIGVMVLGNFDRQSPTRQQYASLQTTLTTLMRQHGIRRNGVFDVISTAGDTFLVIALHQMNHRGQVADARRAAGRPPFFVFTPDGD